MAQLPAAVPQDSLTGGLTEEEHQTARTFAALTLVLVLFSIFGGAKLAPWWIVHSGGPLDYQGEDYDGYIAITTSEECNNDGDDNFNEECIDGIDDNECDYIENNEIDGFR